MNSGHPWKIHRTEGAVPPVDEWPWSDVKTAAGIPPVPPLPVARDVQLQWTDVEYVIGNFFWKARFIDRDGYIFTGDADESTQWNLATQGFVPYHAGEVGKPFNCGRCHTTGYDSTIYDLDPTDPAGHQHGLPGLIGTWTEDGVRCEACHGPAGAHAFGGDPTVHPTGGKACGDCHYRDADFRMPWKGGFTRHHQQAEDLSHSPHAALGCMTCHNPHRSVVYDDGGTIAECTDCHNAGTSDGKTYEVNIPSMAGLECIDCHMPKMGKSAVSLRPNEGDIRGHLFQIMTDAIAAADNVVEADGSPSTDGSGFWKQDPDGKAFATLDYACLSCHDDPGDDVAWAATHAAGIHTFVEPPGDNWEVRIVNSGDIFNVTFTEFAGYLLIETTHADGSTSFGIGFEMSGYIIWIGVGSKDIYFGTIDRAAGTMAGIVFGGGPNNGSMFLGEPL